MHWILPIICSWLFESFILKFFVIFFSGKLLTVAVASIVFISFLGSALIVFPAFSSGIELVSLSGNTLSNASSTVISFRLFIDSEASSLILLIGVEFLLHSLFI